MTISGVALIVFCAAINVPFLKYRANCVCFGFSLGVLMCVIINWIR